MPITIRKNASLGRTRDQLSAARKLEKLSAQEAHDAALIDKLNDNVVRHDADNIELHPLQQQAIQSMITEKYSLTNGQAGTGKTECLVRALPYLIEKAGFFDLKAHVTLGAGRGEPVPAIVFLAWQNKVVRNMQGRLADEYKPNAMTIHKFLAYAPTYVDVEGGKTKQVFEPRYDLTNQHQAKILVIDEIGTVPEPLWKALMDATPDDVSIHVLGDINQLAPVGGRPVLPFAATQWPTTSLTKIYRQSDGSSIIENADRVLRGERPIPANDFRLGTGRVADARTSKRKPDLKQDCILSPDLPDAAQDVGYYLYAAMHAGEYDPDLDMVMTHPNEGPLGRIPLNDLIRTFANGQFSPLPERQKRRPQTISVSDRSVMYSVGDRVVALSGQGGIDKMPSGTAGIITAIIPNPKYRATMDIDDHFINRLLVDDDDDDTSMFAAAEQDDDGDFQDEDGVDDTVQRQASHILEVYCPDIDEQVRVASTGNYNALALNWVGTVHRNQGLQHRKVFIIAHTAFDRYINREWLYTAVTRAQESVTILYREQGLSAALMRKFYVGETATDKAYNYVKNQEGRTKPLVLRKPEKIND